MDSVTFLPINAWVMYLDPKSPECVIALTADLIERRVNYFNDVQKKWEFEQSEQVNLD